MMITLEGKSVFGGVAIGKIQFYKRNEITIKRTRVEDVEAEVERFQNAKAKTLELLKGLYEKALEDVGEANAMIFEAHQLMLEDPDYVESIENIIRTQDVNAEYAIGATADNFAAIFEAMDDAYMQGRAADVRDVSERLLQALSSQNETVMVMDEPVIIAADDLVPSETVQLDKEKVLSFVTMYGSANSHTAILARTMNIPSLVTTNIEIDTAYGGRTAIVDGFTGLIYIDPDEETMEKMKEKKARADEQRALLQEMKGKETVTLSGKHIHLYSNIGGIQDVDAVLENDAEGIGLFRSEFLYLEREDWPTEEFQFDAYGQVAQEMGDRPVIIRTLDIGADKQVDYFNLSHEDNPALGYRAIRICLTRPEIFKVQLRALLRASAYGNIAIMLPMITSVQEVRDAKRILEEAKSELRGERIDFNESIQIGVMIETPASVIMADELAAEVDFFSIGTNDLTQYTLACDRQNPSLERFADPHSPAVLRMIQMTIEAAHRHGIWCGICGELGADLSLTDTFLRLGIDELSVSPTSVLPLRNVIRNH